MLLFKISYQVQNQYTKYFMTTLSKSLQTEDINDYFTYIDYPVEVQRIFIRPIASENPNRQIRRVTKTKVTFDKAENLLDLTFMITKYFEANNWQKFPVHAFNAWQKNTSNMTFPL